MINIFTSILIIVLLSGCATTTGYHSQAEYAGHSSHSSRVENILLYYQGSTIDWPHEQMGLVTATGDKHASTGEVIAHLKMKAQSIGADAIINVHAINRERESGLIFSDDRDTYQAIAYQGVAIRFNDIESLPDHIQSQFKTTDTHSQRIVKAENDRKSSSAAFEMILSVVLGVAYLIAL